MQEPGTVELQHLPSLPRDLGGVPAQPALRSRLVVTWNGCNRLTRVSRSASLASRRRCHAESQQTRRSTRRGDFDFKSSLRLLPTSTMPFQNKKWVYSGEERTFTGSDKVRVYCGCAVKSLKTDMDGYRHFQDAAPSPSEIISSPGERQRFRRRARTGTTPSGGA